MYHIWLRCHMHDRRLISSGDLRISQQCESLPYLLTKSTHFTWVGKIRIYTFTYSSSYTCFSLQLLHLAQIIFALPPQWASLWWNRSWDYWVGQSIVLIWFWLTVPDWCRKDRWLSFESNVAVEGGVEVDLALWPLVSPHASHSDVTDGSHPQYAGKALQGENLHWQQTKAAEPCFSIWNSYQHAWTVHGRNVTRCKLQK